MLKENTPIIKCIFIVIHTHTSYLSISVWEYLCNRIEEREK